MDRFRRLVLADALAGAPEASPHRLEIDARLGFRGARAGHAWLAVAITGLAALLVAGPALFALPAAGAPHAAGIAAYARPPAAVVSGLPAIRQHAAFPVHELAVGSLLSSHYRPAQAPDPERVELVYRFNGQDVSVAEWADRNPALAADFGLKPGAGPPNGRLVVGSTTWAAWVAANGSVHMLAAKTADGVVVVLAPGSPAGWTSGTATLLAAAAG